MQLFITSRQSSICDYITEPSESSTTIFYPPIMENGTTLTAAVMTIQVGRCFSALFSIFLHFLPFIIWCFLSRLVSSYLPRLFMCPARVLLSPFPPLYERLSHPHDIKFQSVLELSMPKTYLLPDVHLLIFTLTMGGNHRKPYDTTL